MRKYILTGSCELLVARIERVEGGAEVLFAAFGSFIGEELDDDAAEVFRPRLNV